MSKKTSRSADLVFGIILVLLSFWFGIRSILLFKNPFGKSVEQLTEEQIQKNLADWYNSPGLIPLIFSSLLLLCAIYLIVNAIKELNKMKIIEENLELEENEKKEAVVNNIEENVEEVVDKENGEDKFFARGEFVISLKVIGLLGAYLFIVIPLFRKYLNFFPVFQGFPFLLATFVYLATFIIIFNEKTIKKIITSLIVAAVGSAAITIGFGIAAKILLP